MVKRNNRSFRKKQKSKKKINRKKIKQRTRKKYTKRRNAKRQIYRKVGGSFGRAKRPLIQHQDSWVKKYDTRKERERIRGEARKGKERTREEAQSTKKPDEGSPVKPDGYDGEPGVPPPSEPGSSGAWPATKLEQVKNWLFINTGNPKYNSDALAGKVCGILTKEGIPEGEWISSLPVYFKREYLEMVLDDLLD